MSFDGEEDSSKSDTDDQPASPRRTRATRSRTVQAPANKRGPDQTGLEVASIRRRTVATGSHTTPTSLREQGTDQTDRETASNEGVSITLKFTDISLAQSNLGGMKACDLAMAAGDVDTLPEGFRFVCPVKSCPVQFSPVCSYDEF